MAYKRMIQLFSSRARDKVDESLEKLRTQVELNIEGEDIGKHDFVFFLLLGVVHFVVKK